MTQDFTSDTEKFEYLVRKQERNRVLDEIIEWIELEEGEGKDTVILPEHLKNFINKL
mgnify:CR=1 FL=1